MGVGSEGIYQSNFFCFPCFCRGLDDPPPHKFDALGTRTMTLNCLTLININLNPQYKRGVHYNIRQLRLYSTDDKPSYELELCPNRKKSNYLSSFFIFSSEKCPFLFFLFFFPQTSAGQEILFLFFPSEMQEKPLSGSVIHRI